MNQTRSLEIKVGVVSIAAIILLILGLSFGKGFDFSPNKVDIKLRFQTSGGLAKNAPVMVNGVKRGVVKEVLNDKGGVLVLAQLDNIDDLKSDVGARISVLEITGGKKVEIFPGASQTPFAAVNEISGTTSADIADLVTLGGDLSKDAALLIKRIDTIAAAASAMMADGKLTAEIRNAVSQTNALVSTLNAELSANMNDINQIVKNIRTITTNLKDDYAEYEPKIGALVDRLDEIAKATRATLTKADSAISSADRLIANADGMVTDIRSGSGTVSKLIYDKQFAIRLDSALTSVQALVDQIKNHGINTNIRFGTRP